MSIILILMAWFIDMPLWLSIVTTVIASIRLCLNFYTTLNNIDESIDE